MIRPYKDIKEFIEKTGLHIGDTITLRVKQNTLPSEFYLHDGMIIGFDYSHKSICIGGRNYSLEVLSKFEYLKVRTWVPFVVEEESRPAKFQVGKSYFYYDDDDYEGKLFVNARYVDPRDNKLKLVMEGSLIKDVNVGQDGKEYIDFCESEDGVLKAINEVKND